VDGRWEARHCSARYGTAQPVPHTGYENELLREAAGGKPVLLDFKLPQRLRRARR
jgi:hypothetical protein